MIPHNVALSVDETDQMSDLLAAKYIARADELTPTLIEATSVVLAARLSRYLYEQRNRPDENETLRDACVFCEGMLLEDRVTVDKRNHVVTPCWACRPRAFCAYHAMIARHEESQVVGLDVAVNEPRRACPGCGAVDPPCICASLIGARHEESQAEHFCCGHYLGYMRECPTCAAPRRCSACKADDAPATLRTGAAPDGIERRDPWDLASEELNETVALPREVPAYWGRDRGDYDANDDKADIESHDKLTSYPWGSK